MTRCASMLRLGLLLAAGFPLVVCPLLVAAGGSARETDLRLVQTIPLPDVEGRIDHMAVDLKGQRLFVAALGNNTVETVDLRAGKRASRISGLHEPQGVAFAPRSNRLFVSNGENGALDIYDAGTYKEIGRVSLSDDADNIRYDAETDRIYVGYGDGAIGAVDASGGKVIGTTRLAGHPESFQLERDGPRIFINVPSEGQIAVADRDSEQVLAVWPLPGDRANFPMALDEAGRRLFVGCRHPARLLVYDTESGRQVGSAAIDGDCDDVFLDAAGRRLYVSCGAGFIDIVERRDADSCFVAARLPTAAGARTALYVPELGRLYLAVPHRGAQGAEIRVYEAGP